MAAITNLTAIPDPGGVFTTANHDQLNSNVATTNANNTALNAALATLGAAAVYHATYNFAVDGGGAPGLITPAVNSTIPTNFVIQNVIINTTTAILAAGGAASISIGLSAGGAGAAALLAATVKATFSLNSNQQGIPTYSDLTKLIKMSAPGVVTLTSSTNALTAGVVEIYLFGYLSAS